MRTTGLFVGLIIVTVAPVAAGAADRFVSMGGHDTGNGCLTATSPCATVSYATSQAASGDTIKVAGAHRYRESLSVTTSQILTFLGGSDATFAFDTCPRSVPAGILS